VKIKLFGMDIDGVFTDAGIYLGNSGQEFKKFNAHDGMGVTLLIRSGIVPFIITGRTSEAVARRAVELSISEVHQGVRRKEECLEEIASRLVVELGEIAYVGDDIADLSVLKRVGLPIAVGDAVAEVREVAKYVTRATGGNGAVREACEHVIRLNGHQGSFYSLLED
jgi:3-deoxy-D-manno-octulosonate 8-phosphate phosphatase (KDO 8-P phosphatase)